MPQLSPPLHHPDGNPLSGRPLPPDVIALAVRWYLRFRRSDADVAALLAERGIDVDAPAIYDRVREFAPLYEDIAPPFRRSVGSTWRVDGTSASVVSTSVYVSRAIDASERRAATDVATGVALDEVTTDCAVAYPPALAAVLPSALHETGKAVQQRIERDHQHRKGRLRPLRGCETLVGATMLCAGHASLRNLRGGFYDFGRPVDAASAATRPPVVQAWAAPKGVLLAW